jgi:PKD repeat protein
MVIGVAAGGPVNITDHPANDDAPAWSPMAQDCICKQSRRVGRGLFDESGWVRRGSSDQQYRIHGGPTWSPDSARIAFDCVIDVGNFDICAVNCGWVRLRPLDHQSGARFRSGMVADGTKIAFATARYSPDPTGFYGLDMQLAVMNPDGSGVTPLGIDGFDPSWSPTGDGFAFVRTEPCIFMLCSYVYANDFVAEGFDPAWRPTLGQPPMGPAVAFSRLGAWLLTCHRSASAAAREWLVSSNYGGADLTISSIVASGDFAQSNNCGGNVAVGANCTISVTFTPSSSGPRSGMLSVTDNASGSPHVVPLSGVGDFPPLASFTSVCSGLTCNFDSSASYDPDGTIAGYVWRFGDGTDGSRPATTSHTYAASGTYIVTLTATDNAGVTGSKSASVTVTLIPESMHVGDLDGAATATQKNTWSASVRVTIESSSTSGVVANAMVGGAWSSGGTSSCMTSGSGQCNVTRTGFQEHSEHDVHGGQRDARDSELQPSGQPRPRW